MSKSWTNAHDWQGRYTNYVWNPGINSAICHSSHLFEHLRCKISPNPECECGLYAYHDIERAANNYLRYSAVVAVMGWGENTCIHSDRWRSQHAQVIAVLDHPSSPLGPNLAKSFNVPLLEKQALEVYMREFGSFYYKGGVPPFKLPFRPWDQWGRKRLWWESLYLAHLGENLLGKKGDFRDFTNFADKIQNMAQRIGLDLNGQSSEVVYGQIMLARNMLHSHQFNKENSDWWAGRLCDIETRYLDLRMILRDYV